MAGSLLPRSRRSTWIALFCCIIGAVALSCITKSREASSSGGGGKPCQVQNDSINELCIDINATSAGELEKLPGVGKGIARRIVEHRERHGRFRRVEHLMMVRGISERRFNEMRSFVRAE